MKNKNLSNFLVIAALAVAFTSVGMVSYNQGISDQEALIKKAAVKTPAASTDNKLYNQLVQQYKNTRIQIRSTCQITPVSFSLRNGTNVLLDNRSAAAHTVSINGASYNLPAYGYQVVAISSSAVPAKFGINCDGSVNVGTIQLYQ